MTNNIQFSVICHDEINQDQIDDIIELKQKYWPYSYESQHKWISDNLFGDDLHILAHKDGVLVGYLDIVKVGITTEVARYDTLGLGNVCVNPDFGKMGIGRLCVLKANEIIDEQNKAGILLCADKLTVFYRKCNWIVLATKGKKYIVGKEFSGNVMVYCNKFADELNMCPRKLEISRNF